MPKIIPYGHQSIDKSDIQAVVQVLKSDRITQGPIIDKFENTLAKFVGAKYAVCVSSGTAALHAACIASGIESGDEVIVPTLSFVATANCVLYCGAKPVLVDVYVDTLTINAEEVAKKITKKTKAIIAVDFAGHPADWDKLRKLAQKHDLILIDDAAHALGSVYKEKSIGSIAGLTAFSFHPVKTITTGEGGAIATNSEALYGRLKKFRHHGIEKDKKNDKKYGSWYYDINNLGYNYRITDLQAALGLSQLKKIKKNIKVRRFLWNRYKEKLNNLKAIDLPIEKDNAISAWHIYPIRLNNKAKKSRREVFDFLRKANIGVQVHYIPIHFHSLYKKLFGYAKGDFPVAEKYYESALSLPLYVSLSKQDQDYVIRKLKESLYEEN